MFYNLYADDVKMLNDLWLTVIFVGILIGLGKIIGKTIEATWAALVVGISIIILNLLGFPFCADAIEYLMVALPSNIVEIFI